MHFPWQAPQYKRHVHERLGGQGAHFLRGACILEHQICRFTKMILRDRCSTSYDLASIFRGRRSTLDRWSRKNPKTYWYEAVSAALNFPFLKEVSQNCFVSDVVKFKNWRSLAELRRFGRCQVKKRKKSRRIVSFLTLIKKLTARQVDRQTDRQTERERDREIER